MQAIFRRATARRPSERECGVLLGLLAKQRARFAGDASEARRLVAAATGDAAAGDDVAGDADRDVQELAAWTAVAQVILNLDEVLTSR
jgi:hypothetical protein